jgi:hypothetical protein
MVLATKNNFAKTKRLPAKTLTRTLEPIFENTRFGKTPPLKDQT